MCRRWSSRSTIALRELLKASRNSPFQPVSTAIGHDSAVPAPRPQVLPFRCVAAGMRARLLVVAVLLLAAGASPANAQQTTPCDQETYTYSKVSRPKQYDVLPQEIVTLKSKRDGVDIQIGLIRPKVPAGTRVPVIV